MAGNKVKLKEDIKAIFAELSAYDGSAGKQQSDAMEVFSSKLSDAISNYVLTLNIQATPADVVTAAMVAGGQYPVIAANALSSKVIEP